jgi:hypothetical protein
MGLLCATSNRMPQGFVPKVSRSGYNCQFLTAGLRIQFQGNPLKTCDRKKWHSYSLYPVPFYFFSIIPAILHSHAPPPPGVWTVGPKEIALTQSDALSFSHKIRKENYQPQADISLRTQFKSHVHINAEMFFLEHQAIITLT